MCRYTFTYVKNVYNYFHDFRIPVEYATMKIEITIENGRSLKLRFQFRIGFVKYIVAHSIRLQFAQFLARSNAVSIHETTPVSKMRKYYFSVLVGLIRSILEGEYA